MSTSTSNEIKVTVTPWSSENCFEIMKLHLYEELGGFVAKGSIDFIITSTENQDTLDKLTEEKSGVLKIKDLRKNGLEYTIPFIVTARDWKITSFSIEFRCIGNEDFLISHTIQSYKNISEAIDLLYPGEKDIRVQPDCNISDLPIHQSYNETGYDLCSRLCTSFRKDTIFCFGWEGLMIKELCGEFNSFGKVDSMSLENASILVTSLEFGSLFPTAFSYNKLLNYEPVDVFNTGYCTASINNDNYFMQRSEYVGLTNNYNYNRRLYQGLYSMEVIKGIHMPRYKIGDVITYAVSEPGPKTPYYSYVCYSNEFFYSLLGASNKDKDGFKVSWESKLLGLDRGTWAGEVVDQSYLEPEPYVPVVDSAVDNSNVISDILDYLGSKPEIGINAEMEMTELHEGESTIVIVDDEATDFFENSDEEEEDID